MPEPDISGLVCVPELHVRRRARARQHGGPVAQDGGLREGAMSVARGEFVRVEVLAGGLAACNEEEVVDEEGARVRQRKHRVEEHGEGHTLLSTSA